MRIRPEDPRSAAGPRLTSGRSLLPPAFIVVLTLHCAASAGELIGLPLRRSLRCQCPSRRQCKLLLKMYAQETTPDLKRLLGGSSLPAAIVSLRHDDARGPPI